MQALYRWFSRDGELLYVGISQSLWNRTKQHEKTAEWFSHISFCTVEWFNSREAVERAENLAIATENPIFNKTPQVQRSRPTLVITPPNINSDLVIGMLREKVTRLNDKIDLQSKLLQRQELLKEHDRRLNERMWKIIEQRTTRNAQTR